MDNKVRKNKIDWDFWLNMPTVTIGQAVALSLGKDPDKMSQTRTCDGWKYLDDSFKTEEEENKFYKRCRLLINNAFSDKNIRSTECLLVGINQSQDHTAKIHLEYFPEWTISVNWDIPKELKSLVDPENLPTETKQEETESEETELDTVLCPSDFDLVTKKEITTMFDKLVRLGKDQTASDKWKELFKRAHRNGLQELKEEGGFNPCKVGNWLVKKGHYQRELVERKLINNLPSRSRDKKYLIDEYKI